MAVAWRVALAAVAPWLIMAAVNLGLGPAGEGPAPDRCTRTCHDRGCPHTPALPLAIAGDQGLYGATIRGLFRAGRASGLGRRRGYGAVNLLLFCVAWPGAMLGLLALVTWQRRRIKTLGRRLEP